MQRYTEITLAEFESALEPYGFYQINLRNVSECVFESKMFDDERFVVRVYSSIIPGQDRSRSKGKDAIRIVLRYIDEDNNFMLAKFKRTHRTQNWKFNLMMKLSNIQKSYVSKSKCPKCGSGLILRQGKFGHFYGCANFVITKCRGSLRITDTEIRKIAQELG